MSGVLKRLLIAAALLQTWAACDRPLAQPSDAILLRQFCQLTSIKGNECSNARNYARGRRCNVKLNEDRYTGRYIGSQELLVVRYESDCEAHSNDFGGSIIFERVGGGYAFRGYQPGIVFSECASIPRGPRQDRLICLTGHMGQGQLEASVSEVVFRRRVLSSIRASLDILLTATDTEGAYGTNKVECNATRILFGLSNIERGPTADTVHVSATYADREAIQQACRPAHRGPRRPSATSVPGKPSSTPRPSRRGDFCCTSGPRNCSRNRPVSRDTGQSANTARPSAASVMPGACTTSQGCPSGSVK